MNVDYTALLRRIAEALEKIANHLTGEAPAIKGD